MKFLKHFSLLNTLRVTPSEIKKETRKKFLLGITGSKEMVMPFYEILTRGMPEDVLEANVEFKKDDYVNVLEFPIKPEDRRTLKTDVLVFLLTKEDATRENLLHYRDLYKLRPPAHLFIEEPDTNREKEELYETMDMLDISGREWIAPVTEESIKDKAEVLLNVNNRVDLAMAYRFPILREAMSQKLINKTGIQNMVIGLASSLPATIPIIGIIIGLLGVAGETTVLTMNQLKLCMQLAGLYGLELNLMDRIKELWPLVGTALGFRTIARSLVGFIPFAGPSIKGGIAYAGTYLVGETARWYYEKGRKLTPDEKKRIYDEAYQRARVSAAMFIDKLKGTIKEAPPESGKTGESSGLPEIDVQKLEEELEALRSDINKLEPDLENTPVADEVLKRTEEEAGVPTGKMKLEEKAETPKQTRTMKEEKPKKEENSGPEKEEKEEKPREEVKAEKAEKEETDSKKGNKKAKDGNKGKNKK